MIGPNSDRVWWGRARGGRACSALLCTGATLAMAGAAFIEVALARPGDGPSQALALTIGMLLWAAALRLAVRATTVSLVVVRISVYVVEIRTGPLPFPSMQVPLRRIRTARTVSVPRPSWSGWGRRRTRRGQVIIARPGPALELCLTSGRIVVVTVDEPGQALAVLRHLGVPVS